MQTSVALQLAQHISYTSLYTKVSMWKQPLAVFGIVEPLPSPD